MINIGIIYLQGCSRHTGQKRLRKRDPLLKKRGVKVGGRQRWEHRDLGEERAECHGHHGGSGERHNGHFTAPVERCEVPRTVYWLPVALDPPSGGEQPIAVGALP